MKRTRKTRKTFTDAQKRGLVNEVMNLVTQGLGVTEARSKIALKHKTTPISLARWSKDMVNTTTNNHNIKVTGRITAVKPHITSVDLHIPGTGNVTLDSEMLNHISKLAGYTS